MIKILKPWKKFSFAYLILFLFPTILWAQENNSIKLISYRAENSILLRWAPTTAANWLELNKTGYTLERFVLTRDSVRVYPPENRVIETSIKPGLLSDWEPLARDNDFAKVMAQAIYGESFDAALDKNSRVLRAIQISKGQELRFSYALLAADQSFEVATMAGLGFEDTETKQNETYLYKLYGSSGLVASDTAYSVVSTYYKTPLPSIINIEVDFQDKKVEFSWPTEYLKDVYTSYLIEKSEDNIRFRTLNALAIITTSSNFSGSPNWIIKYDSLDQNDKFYYYRIRGSTPFGILGPYSETLKGAGSQELSLSIGIVETINIDQGILVSWQVEDSFKQILNFQIERSLDAINYILLDSVSGSSRTYVDVTPNSANYYRIIARDKKGQRIESLPYFAQLEDSIPPNIPSGLEGFCDSTGVVTLRWNKVKDSDILSYRVFRSRVESSDFIQRTIAPLRDTVYSDSINLITLSNKIYYKVSAVDKRGNMSAQSSAFLIPLYDVTPPMPPRITGFNNKSEGTEIEWINSSSSDVVLTKVYSRVGDSTRLIKEVLLEEGLNTFIDTAYYTKAHSYYLKAVDRTGNDSENSNTVRIDKSSTRIVDDIKLTVKVDRTENLIQLNWDLVKGVRAYKLYKSKGDEPISLYKVFSGSISSYSDGLLEINSRYNYMLQVVNGDVEDSFFSQQVEIMY